MKVEKKQKPYTHHSAVKMLMRGGIIIGVAAVLLCSALVLRNGVWAKRGHEGNVLIEEVVSVHDVELRQSIHYPHYQSERLNGLIGLYVSEVQKSGLPAFMDYETYIAYDRFLTIRFQLELDGEAHLLEPLQYDLRQDLPLSLKDVFHKDKYEQLKQDGVGEDFQIEEDGIVFDEGKVLYVDHKEDILLQDPNIPSLYPHYPIKKTKRILDPNKPMIALTFDDGPANKDNLTRIMKIMEQYDGAASFFMLGQQVERHPELVQELSLKGHEIGNHTYAHTTYNGSNLEKIKEEITRTDRIIYQATGQPVSYYRPVGGSYDQTLVEKIDHGVVMWNVDTQDWLIRKPERIFEETIKGLQDGAIVLFHDIYGSTVTAIEQLVPYLTQQGYQLVTLSELAEYKGSNRIF